MKIKVGDFVAYDIGEVARILHCDEDTVKRFLANGRLRGTKIGKNCYVTQESLKALFNHHDQFGGQDQAKTEQEPAVPGGKWTREEMDRMKRATS